MPDWSRRAVLLAGGGALAALSGCQFTDGSASSRDDDHDWSANDRREETIDDYEYERVRDPDAPALFTRGEFDAQRGHGSYDHVTSDEELADVSFDDGESGERLRSFAEATDMETESVFLFWRRVGACYDLEIDSVTVDDDSARATFCESDRPADVSCDGDAEVTVGYAIRLPVAGDGFSGQGSGYRSSCGRPGRPEPFDANVTVAERGEER